MCQPPVNWICKSIRVILENQLTTIILLMRGKFMRMTSIQFSYNKDKTITLTTD